MVIITLLLMLALTSVCIFIYYTEFRGLKCRVKRLEAAMSGLNKNYLDLKAEFEERQKEVKTLIEKNALRTENVMSICKGQEAEIVEFKKELSKQKAVKKDSTPKVKRVKKEVKDGKKAGK